MGISTTERTHVIGFFKNIPGIKSYCLQRKPDKFLRYSLSCMGEKQTSTHFKRFYDPVTEIKSRDVGGIIIIIIIIIINARKYG
jgi:hypothetical protein